MRRVIGLGGIFIKSKNPKELQEWYKKHLGLPVEDYGGASLKWSNFQKKENDQYSVWSAFKETTTYLDPSKSSFMINFIVEDLTALLEVLKSEGVEIVGDPIDEDYGKFGWVMDPDGNKIELWQPK